MEKMKISITEQPLSFSSPDYKSFSITEHGWNMQQKTNTDLTDTESFPQY